MTSTIVLRVAADADAPALRRLAALDDAPALEGSVLMAVVDGEPTAALSLGDGRVVANPFRLTEHQVALLRLQADHMAVRLPRRRRRRLARLRPRFA
jgi:uncharacterized protein with von Willebrand factor type A (vWA) domain